MYFFKSVPKRYFVVNGILLSKVSDSSLLSFSFGKALRFRQSDGGPTKLSQSLPSLPAFPSSRWSDGSDNLVRGIEQGVCMQAESNPSVWNTGTEVQRASDKLGQQKRGESRVLSSVCRRCLFVSIVLGSLSSILFRQRTYLCTTSSISQSIN
jgi:hypothetical protein